jgi:large subunit ribosomal protein L20
MRVKRGNVSRNRHKKVLKLAKGFRGSRSKLFKVANQAVMKAMRHSYRDRRNKKRDIRRLWIVRINAAARLQGLSYSRFINGLAKSGINVNRKFLADIAVNSPETFVKIADQVKLALASA